MAHSKVGIFISQHKYVIALLKETRKVDCELVDIAIEPNHKLGEAIDDVVIDWDKYQRLGKAYVSSTYKTGYFFL